MYTVLYVDDEPALLEIGKLFLEQSGKLIVDTIGSATEAQTLLCSKRYDGIISDYQMPGMDGIEFLKKIRSSGNTTPFIVFTGRGREEIVIQALNEGADFYIQKGGEPKSQFAELTHKVLVAIDHHRSAGKIESLNRLYSVLSATNRAMIHLRTKSGFFSEICRILVETGGFRMAWIGLVDEEQATVKPVASAGYVDGYLDHVDISTEDVPRGRGLTGTAYREGKYFLSNDITRDPHMDPWREDALKRGYRANASFPFSLGTKNAGVISLYAPETGFFDDQIVDLLQELVGDLSFAVRMIDEEDDRKNAEEALRESEERLRFALEGANDGLWDVNMTTGEVFVSSRGCEILGYEPAELPEIAGVWSDLVYEEDLPATQAALSAYLEGKTDLFQIEQRLKMKSGQLKWILSRGKIVKRGDDGKPTRMTGTHTDITDRKKAENNLLIMNERLAAAEEELRTQYDTLAENQKILAASEEKYRAILENMQDVYYRTDVFETLVMVSPSGAVLLGYQDIEDMIGRPAKEFYADPIQRDSFLATLKKTQSVSNREIALKRKDGSSITVSTSSHICYDTCGNYAGAEGIFRDITQLKQVQEELRQSEEQYRVLVENSQDGVFLMQEGILTFCNETFATMIGYAPAEIIGLPVPLLIAPEDRTMVMERQQSRLAGKPVQKSYEFKMLHKDAVTRILVKLSVGVGTYKNRPAVIGTVRDVTTEHKPEQTVRENEEQFP